jgi:uncharacterized protein (DUF1697 family)
MATHLAFLRAINLGATRVFPKTDIQRVVAEAGFEGVETHINTGNVRLDTRMRSRARIEETLERAFLRDRGFEVPTIVFSAAEFADLARESAALHAAHPGLARHYVYLLKEELAPDAAAAVETMATEKGEMIVRGRAAHALLKPGYQDGVVDPLGAAKRLGIATNRAHTVVEAIAQKWCASHAAQRRV